MKKDKLVYGILFILLFIGFFSRFMFFPDKISEINSDEIVTIVNAKSIVETGKSLDNLSFPVYLNGWGGQSVGLLYLMTLSIKIFGYSLFAVRFPSFIISIISFFVFYDFVFKVTKKEKIALIALFLLVISPWHIQQSLWALDCNLFPHLLLFSIDILYTAFIKQKKKLLYLGVFFLAISMYFYVVSFLFVPLFLLFLLVYLKKNNIIKLKDMVFMLLLFIIIILPLMITMILNVFHINKSFQFLKVTIPYYSNLNRNDSLLFFSDNMGRQLLHNIKSVFLVLFFQIDYTTWNASKGFGIFYHITILFVIIGFIYILKLKKYRILLLWLLIALVDSLIINYANISKLNFLWYNLIIIGSIGIDSIYNRVSLRMKNIYVSIILVLYLVLFGNYLFDFATNSYKNIIYSDNFSKGFYQSLIFTKTMDKDIIYYDNTSNDHSMKLYIQFFNDSSKKYYELNEKYLVEEKINNIKDNELIIIDKKYNNNISMQYKNIGDFLVLYDN